MRLSLILSLIFFTHFAQSNIAIVREPCVEGGPEVQGVVPYTGNTLASRIMKTYFSFDNEKDRRIAVSLGGKYRALRSEYRAKGFNEDEIKLLLSLQYGDDVGNSPINKVRWQDRDRYKEYWFKQKDTSHGYETNLDFVESLLKPARPMSQCTLFVYIYDEVRQKDVKKLKSALTNFANPPFLYVTLNSSGGSVKAGIELGRLVREHYGIVDVNSDNLATTTAALNTLMPQVINFDTGLVDKDRIDTELLAHHNENMKNAKGANGKFKDIRGQCYSACVLIYAGGIARLATFTANIGVHQHFLEKDYVKTLSVEEGVKQLKQTTQDIANYFDELGINPELLQVALSVDKNKIRILDLCELQVLLPSAVSEYANVIPAKYEQQFSVLDDLMTRYMYESLDQSNTLTEILNYSYAALEREKPNIKWVGFYEYGLRSGMHIQKQDRTGVKCKK